MSSQGAAIDMVCALCYHPIHAPGCQYGVTGIMDFPPALLKMASICGCSADNVDHDKLMEGIQRMYEGLVDGID